MKTFICTVLFLFLSTLALGKNNRCVVFFADTSDIPEAVINKILSSKRFCITVPVNSAIGVPENLKTLVSYGRIELALSFNPEPVLPVVAMLSNTHLKKSNKRSIFEEYISTNLTDYKNHTNKQASGIFLNFAELSHDILYYLSGLGLTWINSDNFEKNLYGACNIDGIVVFSIYKNFPYNQIGVMKWLESKKENNIVPVLLTKKHLQNVKLMEYLIDAFDNSKYIMPATPWYISELKNNLPVQKNIHFKQLLISPSVKEKLFLAVDLINNYANKPNFKEHAYTNVQSELACLCSYNLLKDVLLDRPDGKRMFDSTYKNIYHLLEASEPEDEKAHSIPATKKVFFSNIQTFVEVVPDGVSISNEGLLKFVQVLSKDNNIRIDFSFKSEKWNDDIAFVDFYIDLNNIKGAGSTSFLSGVNGFLTTDSGWEYSLRVYKNKAVLYKYSLNGASFVSNLSVCGGSVLIPQKYIRGNPANWGFQAIVVSEIGGEKAVVDFFNQSSNTKDKILSTKPFQVSAIRIIR
ncbi:hypothetical protein AGMMS50222_07710 [Endomicrobiia bacterium]|nr:hypothetical protein AGMMS49556_05440 [Endomicrobiia bacterium]GHT75880.1 hypothetical protein AGMMS50222_07710 [Endomicrobiia bacterium]